MTTSQRPPSHPGRWFPEGPASHLVYFKHLMARMCVCVCVSVLHCDYPPPPPPMCLFSPQISRLRQQPAPQPQLGAWRWLAGLPNVSQDQHLTLGRNLGPPLLSVTLSAAGSGSVRQCVNHFMGKQCQHFVMKKEK